MVERRVIAVAMRTNLDSVQNSVEIAECQMVGDPVVEFAHPSGWLRIDGKSAMKELAQIVGCAARADDEDISFAKRRQGLAEPKMSLRAFHHVDRDLHDRDIRSGESDHQWDPRAMIETAIAL